MIPEVNPANQLVILMESTGYLWTTGHFETTLLPNKLFVGHVKNEVLPQITHALVKLLVKDAEDDSDYVSSPRKSSISSSYSGTPTPMGGISEEIQMLNMEELDEDNGESGSGVNMLLVHDVDGCTVIVNERYRRYLTLSNVVSLMDWAPVSWRAMQIHLGPAGADAPGIISYLSSELSEKNISILNFSTFDADLILVQEFDLKKVTALLSAFGKDGVCGLKEQMVEKNLVERVNSPRSPAKKKVFHGALSVLPSNLVLSSIRRSMLKQSMFGLMKHLTRNIDKVSEADSVSSKDFLWAYFSTKEEVSLLVDERDLIDFAEESLTSCPQQWKAIRLVGKDIPFDETGIVKLMSSPYTLGVHLLNLSTFKTNISLVSEQNVNIAVSRLQQDLNSEEVAVL